MVFVAWMGGGGSCIASAPFRIGGKVHRLWDFRDTVYRPMTRVAMKGFCHMAAM